MSVRSYGRFGSYLSVQGDVQVGSGAAVVFDTAVNKEHYIMKETASNELKMYVNLGQPTVNFKNTGGHLEGTFVLDNTFIISDRRFKKDIVPLRKSLRDAIENMKGTPAGEKLHNAAADNSTASVGDESALWLLRQLRPVSYSFRAGHESKQMRFGFIADEMESMLPQVVRKVANKEFVDQKALVYDDLIALLTSSVQDQQRSLQAQHRILQEQKSALQALKAREQQVAADIEHLREKRNKRQKTYELKKKRRKARRRLRAFHSRWG
jgi:hypothetical protein